MKTKIILPAVIAVCLLTSCGKEDSRMVLSGTIEAEQADVHSEIAGKVIDIFAEEGAVVSEGDIIAVLDSEAEELKVQYAESSLEAAEIKLAELEAGTRDEQLRLAEEAVNEAKARLDGVHAGSRPEAVAQAEAQARIQKAKLDELLAGADAEEIRQAEAAFRQAGDAEAAARENLLLAEESQNNAKTLYEASVIPKNKYDEFVLAYNNARLQADTAQQQVVIAKEALELVKKGPGEQTIAAQRAAYEQALSGLELLRSGSTEDAVAAAQAQLGQAEANYEMLNNGSTEYVISTAKAAVAQQEANLKLELLNLEKYNIKTPASGTVLYNNIQKGEIVNVSQIVSTIQATDDFFIKVYVPQKRIGEVSLNGRAIVETSALPGEKLQGVVVFKSPKAEYTPKNIETNEAKEENTVFAVKIKIAEGYEGLSAGMTAYAYFE